MSDCREYEELIDRVSAGEASDAEREALLAHLDSCADCAELYELAGRLGAAALEVEPEPAVEPEEAAFDRMRGAVLSELRSDIRSAPAVARPAFGARPRPWRMAWGALAAALLVALGFAIGARSGGRASAAGAPEGRTALAGPPFAAEIRAAALRHTSFADVENSPYAFSDVRVDPRPDGKVDLGFVVSRRMELELAKDDPLLGELLVQAVLGGATVGGRLAAIDLAADRASDRDLEHAKSALLVAMRNDESLAVRLRAEERLARLPADAEIRGAMLETLSHDDAVQMRLAAIDYLTENRVEPAALERALGASRQPPNGLVAVRASNYLTRSERTDSRGER